MIIVDTALKKRAAEGRPIQVGIVGAGYMGRGMALQIEKSIPGMRVAAIYNRGLPRAAHLVARSSPPRMRRVEHPIYTVTRSEQSNDDHLNEFIERLVTIIALPPKLD